MNKSFNDDILFFFYNGISLLFYICKTKVCREHVDAGHRGRELAGAAVVCVTDVEHGMREHDDLVFKWMFVRRRVG